MWFEEKMSKVTSFCKLIDKGLLNSFRGKNYHIEVDLNTGEFWVGDRGNKNLIYKGCTRFGDVNENNDVHLSTDINLIPMG